MPSKAVQQQFQELVNKLKTLRVSVDNAELELVREARSMELGMKEVWSQFHSAFDEVLEDNHIMDSARYRKLVAAEEAIGPSRVDTIGADAAVEAIKIPSVKHREEFIEAASRRREDEGVPWSAQQAKTARKSIAGQPPTLSLYNKRVTREEELRSENASLRSKIQGLNRQLKEKNETIAKLTRQLAAEVKKNKKP
jgi:catabolite regulation protein CreA